MGPSLSDRGFVTLLKALITVVEDGSVSVFVDKDLRYQNTTLYELVTPNGIVDVLVRRTKPSSTKNTAST